jgi:hypothetical protein
VSVNNHTGLLNDEPKAVQLQIEVQRVTHFKRMKKNHDLQEAGKNIPM